jgi:hypothetical protein
MLMSRPGLNQQSLSGYAHSYRPQGCCAGCCRCQCHYQHYITYTPPMMPGLGSQPWAYQRTADTRGPNVVDFSAHPDYGVEQDDTE